MYKMLLQVLIFVAVEQSLALPELNRRTKREEPGQLCKSCGGADSLDQCTKRITCGKDEVCFTEVYTDDTGKAKYRLGCKERNVCHKNFISGNGKQSPKETSERKCYDCCDRRECNIGMCANFQLNTGCPGNFKPFEDHCYMFDDGQRTRPEAISHCKDLGAELVSIHSKAENDFLDKELKAVNLTLSSGYLTGGYKRVGYYNWYWTDGTTFDYENWRYDRPRTFPDPNLHYHLIVTNPAYSDYHTKWFDSAVKGPGGSICKKKRV